MRESRKARETAASLLARASLLGGRVDIGAKKGIDGRGGGIGRRVLGLPPWSFPLAAPTNSSSNDAGKTLGEKSDKALNNSPREDNEGEADDDGGQLPPSPAAYAAARVALVARQEAKRKAAALALATQNSPSQGGVSSIVCRYVHLGYH